jgi:hypothetical protein
MHGTTLLLISLLAGADYSRSFETSKLDQATLDAEGYGEKKAFERDAQGLRIKLPPGEKETGWKTPQALRIGGNFSITAKFVIDKLPKPAQEDGAAVGIAIAFQNADQPDATLIRLIEPTGSDVYRSISKQGNNPSQPPGMPMPIRFQQQGAKPEKAPRPTFPASGTSVRLELHREGNILRFQVVDGKTDKPRYLGQAQLGTNDVAAVKLFASNRNGAEAINVLLRNLAIHADRFNGLGTTVRTVYGEVIYAEPTAIEKGLLILGGEPKTPPPSKPDAAATKAAPRSSTQPKPTDAAKDAQQRTAAPKPATEKPTGNAVTKAAADSLKTATEPAKAASEPSKPAQVQVTGPKGAAAAAAKPAKPKEPKAKVPLDEVESIHFERTPALAGRFLGQPNIDFTMPAPAPDAAKKDAPGAKPSEKETAAEPKVELKKTAEKPKAEAKKQEPDDVLAPPPGTAAAVKVKKVEPKPNGIRDLHLALANLHNAAIKQVTVTCPTDKGQASWRLDTGDSHDWPLVIRRAATEGWADLFLEPPAGDCHDKQFMVNITFANGQNANIQIKADKHSDPKLAVDPKAPAPPLLDVRVILTGEERLFGKLEKVGEETLKLITPRQEQLDVPLSRVVGVHVGLADRKESPESFAKRLKARANEDILLAQTKDGEVLAIPGIIEGTEGDRLRFRYQDKSRTLPLKQVEGWLLAARPDPETPGESSSIFTLPGGVVVAGKLKDIDTATWKVQTSWGPELSLPAADVQGVRFRGGKMTHLADLNPSKVEETPFFGRKLPWRRNVNLLGRPLTMNGQTFEHGLAVHSRCALTYDLNGRFATFETLLGFDDAAQRKGRVDCRVFADGKEIYANADFRADAPPLKLSLPVAGVEQLRLLVDFGRGQDTGDSVIWADARLYRTARPTPRLSASGPR